MSHPDERDLEGTLAAASGLVSSGDAWVAVDGYQFDDAYLRALKGAGLRVVVIDDLGQFSSHDADLVVNPNLSSEALTYRTSTEALLMTGPTVALLRREFRAARAVREPAPARANRFLVLTGGAGVGRAGPKLVESMRAAGWGDGEGCIVMGPMDPGEDVSAAAQALGPGWRAVRGTDEMPSLMAWADLAVTAGGGSVLELASVGTPTVAMVAASNQRESARALAEIGAIRLLSPAGDLSPEGAVPLLRFLRDDAETRRRMGALGRQMVDGSGAERVARAMGALSGDRGDHDFELRAVTFDDAFLLWRWANDAVVRRNSFETAPIPWETHVEWLREKLGSSATRFWILEYCSIPVATIRYDRAGDAARIGFSVAAPYRGRGLGTKLLLMSASRARRELGVEILEGSVRPENEASARAFRAAGFREGEAGIHVPAARIFRRMEPEGSDRHGM